tara:strand:- start:540 stop:1064 length:525 start_codon:yes stop_codon:yes gene_type:complete
MKKSNNRLVTKLYYDYTNFMDYRGVNFGGKLHYHYKEKLSDINKNIIINYPLNYPTVKIYELGKRELYKFGYPREKQTKSIKCRDIFINGSWAEYIEALYITKSTISFELYDVKDYQDLINKLIKFYNIHRKGEKKCKRYLTNLERVNESAYKNPKRSGAYPDNNFVLEYYEDI